jgi:hypothetical protein
MLKYSAYSPNALAAVQKPQQKDAAVLKQAAEAIDIDLVVHPQRKARSPERDNGLQLATIEPTAVQFLLPPAMLLEHLFQPRDLDNDRRPLAVDSVLNRHSCSD